jgi:hypothetical protein
MVTLSTAAVDVSKIDDSLAQFLRTAGEIHYVLFNMPLVITSANDGNHVAHSAHYLNFAADIRSRDLTPDEQMLFGIVLSYIAPKYKIVVFDERATPGQHWHVQTAASAGA